MSKKKTEHVLFDRDRRVKKNIPLREVNKTVPAAKKSGKRDANEN